MTIKTLFTCLAGAALLLPAVAAARPAYTIEPMRIHAGPGPDYPLIVVVPPGVGLEVAGCLRGYQWCDVIAPDGLRGWAWSGALSFSWNGPPLPVIEYGPSFGIPLISFVIGDYWGRYYRDRPWYDTHRHWRPSPPPVYVAPPPHRAPDDWRRDDRWEGRRDDRWDGRRDERRDDWRRDERHDDRRDDRRPPSPRNERERDRHGNNDGAPPARPNPPPAVAPVAPIAPAPPGGGFQPPPSRRDTPPVEQRRPPEDNASRFRPPPGQETPRMHAPENQNRFGGRMEGDRGERGDRGGRGDR